MDVKGKIKVCRTTLGDFNVEQINSSPFYSRYNEFVRVLHKYLKGSDPEQLLAQPVEDKRRGVLEWYIPHTGEDPDTLSTLRTNDAEAYARYSALRTQCIAQLQQLATQITLPQERIFIDCLLRYLDVDYADDITYCHDGYVSFAAWGMKMRRGRDLATVITDDVREHRIHTVRYHIEGHGTFNGRNEIMRKHGHALQGARDIPEVIPDKHYAFTQWKPCAPQGKRVETDVEYIAICERKDDFEIRFQARQGGKINGQHEVVVTKRPGEPLLDTDIPTVSPEVDWLFKEWQPKLQVGMVIDKDLTFEAVFKAVEKPSEVTPPPPPPQPYSDSKPTTHTVRFVAGDNGFFKPEAISEFNVNHGETLNLQSIPSINAKTGFKFRSWDKPLNSAPITEDITYTALYDTHKPWWKRLKWLWWLLAALLALLALLFFLDTCKGCVSCERHREVNGVVESDTIVNDQGKTIDDNGTAKPIEIGDDGRLPEDDNITAPITGGDEEVPIVEQPGAPSIIANRLFLFLENDKDNVDALARDFCKTYSDQNKYKIIGYDREVKMLVVTVPANERDQLRQTMNQRIRNHKFLVFDEQIYELSSIPASQSNDVPADYGWHLRAVHATQAWTMTKGSPEVKIAVVDDGIQASHPMFAGRIVNAYNVFTQNNHLSLGEGHGTHTAALAAGSQDNLAKGASGMAPLCKIMPIQVFDNKQCPLSALIAGIMYAIHHDADVVNVSIGPSFPGLNQLPPQLQQQLRTQFSNMEALWNRVCAIADKKRCLIVFAAGNDNILACIPPENRNLQSLAIGAVNKQITPTKFTNYGGYCDLSAPGQNILSAFPRNSLRSCDGTSMAAPIVTGTLALMKSIKKDITLAQARNVLQRTGQQVNGDLPPMILADNALIAVKKGDFSAPRQRNSPNPDANMPPNTERNNSGIGSVENPNTGSVGPSQPTDDYEAIRRLIHEYEQKIKELKRRLPQS